MRTCSAGPWPTLTWSSTAPPRSATGGRSRLPPVAEKLRRRQVMYIGRGDRAMNTTYVGNLVEAIFRAAEAPAAVGQVFNVTDGEAVSKRRFFEAVADGLGLPRPKLTV